MSYSYRYSYKDSKGIVLVSALLVLSLLSLISVAALQRTNTDIKISSNVKDIKKAFYIAETGVAHSAEYIRQQVLKDPAVWDSYITPKTLLGMTPFADGNYSVTIEDGGGNRRRIVSTGITRTGAIAQIEVVYAPLMTPKSVFNFALFGGDGVTISGNDDYVDSYDSVIGYIAEADSSNGDVGTNSTVPGAIDLQNGNVYGDAWVGTGSDPVEVVVGPQGHLSGNKYILPQPKDMTPKTDPGGGTSIGDIKTSQILNTGEYRLNKVDILVGDLEINGDVTLYVNTIRIGGLAKIIIHPPGSLKIYCFGTVVNAGNGFINTSQDPSRLVIYGTASCTDIDVTGNSDFHGVVYAPTANVAVKGNADFYGAAVGNFCNAVGGGGGINGVHYDEQLGSLEYYYVQTDVVLVSKRNLI